MHTYRERERASERERESKRESEREREKAKESLYAHMRVRVYLHAHIYTCSHAHVQAVTAIELLALMEHKNAVCLPEITPNDYQVTSVLTNRPLL